MDNNLKNKISEDGSAINEPSILDEKSLADKIYLIRGEKVMLDFELAEIYGYKTKVFNQQVKRNKEKFEDEDFMFQLTEEEINELSRSQNVTLNKSSGMLQSTEQKIKECSRSQNATLNKGSGRGSNIKYKPYCFTESGIFITEQVDAQNDRKLVKLLLGDIDLPFPEQYLDIISKKFKNIGFDIVRAEEEFRPIKFYDIGALVWFARIIEWEFPNFSVDKCLNNLYKAQEIVEEQGSVDNKIHRILLVCMK